MTVYKLSYFELPPFGEAFIKTIFSVSEVCWQWWGGGWLTVLQGLVPLTCLPPPQDSRLAHIISVDTLYAPIRRREYFNIWVCYYWNIPLTLKTSIITTPAAATPSRLPRHITTKRDSAARFYYITVLNTSRTRGPSILPIIGNNRTPQLLLAYPLPLPVYACTH